MTRQLAGITGYPGPQSKLDQLTINDSVIAERKRTWDGRLILVLLCVGLGALATPAIAMAAVTNPVLPLLCLIAFLGGLLSTWSPCGYSSLSLLRPAQPYGAASVARWLPTLVAHGVGYLAGGLVLATALALVGWILPVGGLSGWVLVALGGVGLAYGLQQLQFIRIPYPQRRAQVPHSARLHLPMWRTGLLYGWQLGLNFVTYVRTPIIYLVVVAAVVSGSAAAAVLLLLSLNLGRFLPLSVNALPLADWTVQRWLAIHDQHALRVSAGVLLFSGSLLLALGLA